MLRSTTGLAFIGAVILLAGAGCAPNPTPSPTQPETPPPATTTTDGAISYLTSAADTTTYCDGAKMDSDGYRKTITTEQHAPMNTTGMTQTELIKATLNLATSDKCQEIMSQQELSADADGTVTIPRIDGFAGVSIALCSCKPQVEVNLLRLPGVKKVIWE